MGKAGGGWVVGWVQGDQSWMQDFWPFGQTKIIFNFNPNP